MPPLLQRLTERIPENLDYLGVSYRLMPQLLQYSLILRWITSLLTKNNHFGFGNEQDVPLYVRHATSDLTGEHTCVMVRGLNTSAEKIGVAMRVCER